ncbi:Na+/H+ antiporter subunit E [Mycobacterium asiaticum]|uniref:Sodium:proton antiporter n=1 Tax=Mycobacterium asiaticum TaxID=1790 RepID=A0A1A3NE45_MYCAS|nr:Na+/H+ antiporter subunit E [Mycobacterium asiaticum]OBK20081.1 sodium:proton antiporter [Mycobacterium asiaticum]
MTAALARVATLTAVYLLALTSLKPGDIVLGLVLASLIVGLGGAIGGRDARPGRPPGTSVLRRLAGLPGLIFFTAVDMGRGSWHVAQYCLGLRPMTPGLVTVPIEPNMPTSATAWAIRVGLSPDSVVVDVDDKTGELLLHVLDARDPDAVRRAQAASYRRAQRSVFP